MTSQRVQLIHRLLLRHLALNLVSHHLPTHKHTVTSADVIIRFTYLDGLTSTLLCQLLGFVLQLLLPSLLFLFLLYCDAVFPRNASS